MGLKVDDDEAVLAEDAGARGYPGRELLLLLPFRQLRRGGPEPMVERRRRVMEGSLTLKRDGPLGMKEGSSSFGLYGHWIPKCDLRSDRATGTGRLSLAQWRVGQANG